MTMLTPGKLPHLLLSVANLDPALTSDLMQRVDQRYGVQIVGRDTPAVTTRYLVKAGLVRVIGPSGKGYKHLHVITPAGEEELNRLWDLMHGADAA